MRARSVIIGILLSAVFLYLAFRKADLAAVTHHLAAANYWLLIPAAILTLISLWIRAYRWGVLLHPLQRIDSGRLFSATSIGFAATFSSGVWRARRSDWPARSGSELYDCRCGKIR